MHVDENILDFGFDTHECSGLIPRGRFFQNPLTQKSLILWSAGHRYTELM